MKKSITSICQLLIMICPYYLYSQTYIKVNIDQPPELVINTLDTLTIESGDEIQIGGENIVTGGYGNYIYAWNNATTLSADNISNPVASPAETITYTLTVTDSMDCTVIANQYVIVEEATDIRQHKVNSFIDIFPNPSDGIFNINIEKNSQLKEIIIYVYNISGTLIKKKDMIMDNHSYSDILDLSEKPAGCYILHIHLPNLLNYRKQIIIK